jgi:spore germination protein
LINHVIKSLMLEVANVLPSLSTTDPFTEFIKQHALPINQVKEVDDLGDAINEVFKGKSALLFDAAPTILILETYKSKTRNIEEPVTEAMVRGPRSGFTESLLDNTTLLRQGLMTPELTFIPYEVGTKTKRKLVLAYMEGIANAELVNEAKRRIEQIHIDQVLESGYIEQLIEDNPYSPFPQVQSTERPDRVIAALNEGRVAILLDGTPFALIVPVTFAMLLQSPEDYYERWIPTSLLRLMRYVSAFVSLFLPSIYIAFISFHQGLIPTKLAISIAGTREGVPFPSIIEALIMEISIEVLREAGLRLPRTVGQTVGLVGGLVVGETAVRAGIVSPIMVSVVGLTAISSFAIPQYSAGISLRLLRFVSMFCAAVLGIYGVLLFFLGVCIHLVKLESFGVPYIAPAVPYRLRDWKDFILRFPLRTMKLRPKMMNTQDPVRKS